MGVEYKQQLYLHVQTETAAQASFWQHIKNCKTIPNYLKMCYIFLPCIAGCLKSFKSTTGHSVCFTLKRSNPEFTLKNHSTLKCGTLEESCNSFIVQSWWVKEVKSHVSSIPLILIHEQFLIFFFFLIKRKNDLTFQLHSVVFWEVKILFLSAVRQHAVVSREHLPNYKAVIF